MPNLDSNLLGRDLQVQLNIGVVPEEGQMVAKMLILKQDDERGIDSGVWAEGGGQGLLDIPPIKVKMKPSIPPIRRKQYLISAEGLSSVIKELIKDGILEPCMSPHNTLILPVRKPDDTLSFSTRSEGGK